jgi:hypothetical protein
MNDEKRDETMEALVASTAWTRARVASDVERLAEQLQPARIKDRALDAAERSLESVGARLLGRLKQAPRLLATYALEHPVQGAAVLIGVTAMVWRVAARRQR